MTDGDGRPPALVEYLEAMAAAADKFSREEAVDGGRAACVAALTATTDYLYATAGNALLGVPLFRLAMALDDLHSGNRVPPMLERPPAERRGPKAIPNNVLHQRGAVAGVLDALIASRLLGDNMKAARWVAQKVERLPDLTRTKARSRAEAILKWREEASAGVAGQEVDKTAFVAFRNTLQHVPAEYLLEAARKALEAAVWAEHPVPRGNPSI